MTVTSDLGMTGARDPPVPFGTPWIDRAKIAAANARDVRERTDDDHSFAWGRAMGGRSVAIARAKKKAESITA